MNRDDQQKTPTEGEIGWLAGVIECDGSIMLAAHCRKDTPDKMPKIGVEIKFYNTDSALITKVVDILERLGVGHYIVNRPQKPMLMSNGMTYGAKKEMLAVIVKRLSAAYLLAKILEPWMHGEKSYRLMLVIQYLARRYQKNGFSNAGSSGKNMYDKGDIEIVQRFYRECVTKPSVNKALVEGLLRD